MAEVVVAEGDSKIALFSRRSIITVAIIGALVGIVTWLLVLILERFLLEPLFCNSTSSFSVCSNAGSIASNIATVFAAVFGIFALVRYGYFRPLVIAIASACVLWGLVPALGGVAWYEKAIWIVLVSALTYVTFAWLTRYRRFAIMLVAVIIAVIVVRLMTIH